MGLWAITVAGGLVVVRTYRGRTELEAAPRLVAPSLVAALSRVTGRCLGTYLSPLGLGLCRRCERVLMTSGPVQPG